MMVDLSIDIKRQWHTGSRVSHFLHVSVCVCAKLNALYIVNCPILKMVVSFRRRVVSGRPKTLP